jgi:hypothetical protein
VTTWQPVKRRQAEIETAAVMRRMLEVMEVLQGCERPVVGRAGAT